MKIVVKKALGSPTIVSALVISGTVYYAIKHFLGGNNIKNARDDKQEDAPEPKLPEVTNPVEGELKPEGWQNEPANPIKQYTGPAQQFNNSNILPSSSNSSLVIVPPPGTSEALGNSLGSIGGETSSEFIIL